MDGDLTLAAHSCNRIRMDENGVATKADTSQLITELKTDIGELRTEIKAEMSHWNNESTAGSNP